MYIAQIDRVNKHTNIILLWPAFNVRALKDNLLFKKTACSSLARRSQKCIWLQHVGKQLEVYQPPPVSIDVFVFLLESFDVFWSLLMSADPRLTSSSWSPKTPPLSPISAGRSKDFRYYNLWVGVLNQRNGPTAFWLANEQQCRSFLTSKPKSFAH